MRTVITISLNGNAYQLDAVGFDALRAYLQVAEQRLAGNPDQEEILADLEQAIADKCNRYLGPHKNVVSASELTAVLREMGPVDGAEGGAGAWSTASSGAGSAGDSWDGVSGAGGAGPDGVGSSVGMSTGMGSATEASGSAAPDVGSAGVGGTPGSGGAASGTAGVGGATGATAAGGTGSAAGMGGPGGATAGGSASGAGATVRRLYLIREGAYIAGVCKGLAAYLNLDISIVRLLFIVLTVLTGGAWILVYIVMMFVVPYAETSEQHAAAHGWPFNAEEVIARAKAYYAEFTSSEKWRRQQWRQQRRMWRSQNKTWQEQRRAWERAGGVAGGPPPPPPSWSAAPPTNMSYSSQVMSGVLTPLVELIGALLFVGFLLALVSLATHHRLFGWTLPGDVPGWVAILVLIVIYRAVVSPLRQARFAAYYGSPFGAGWLVLCGVLVWLVLLSWFGWWAWQHWDQILTIFQQITATLRNLIDHGQPTTAHPAQAALQWLPGAPSCLLWGCGKLEAHG